MPEESEARTPRGSVEGAAATGGGAGLITYALMSYGPELSPEVFAGAVGLLGAVWTGLGSEVRDYVHENAENERTGIRKFVFEWFARVLAKVSA